MAMEGLGRLFNVMPIAAGVAINMQVGSGITFVCTGDDTFTLTVATTFAGSYVAPPTTTIGGGMIHNYYITTTAGTAAWTKTTLASGSYVNAVTIASGVVAFAVYGIDMAAFGAGDTTFYQYIKCTQGVSGLVTAIPHDLVHQRGPANLTILSA